MSLSEIRHSKKGIQLAASFLVIIIISVTVFGMGVFLVSKFFSITGDVEAKISAQTQREIEQRLIDAGEKVSLPFNKKKVEIGERTAFGMGILNTLEQEKTFKPEVCFHKSFNTVTQVPGQLDEPSFINENWIFTDLPATTLKRSELQVLPISVFVAGKMSETAATERGMIYVFNVCVYKEGAPTTACGEGSVCASPNPGQTALARLHGNQIKKLYVEVPK